MMKVVEFVQDGLGRNIERRSYDVEDGGIEMDDGKSFPIKVFFETVVEQDLIEVCELNEITHDELPPYSQPRADAAREMFHAGVGWATVARVDEFAACTGRGVTLEEKEAAKAKAAAELRTELVANLRRRHAEEIELQEQMEKMKPKPKK